METPPGWASGIILAINLALQVNVGVLLVSVQPRALHNRAVLHKAWVGGQAGADFLTVVHPTGLSGDSASQNQARAQRAAAAIC
jgi:hypothetical protein